MATYTVWVDGAEVNDYLLSVTEAMALARKYELMGYDALIEEVR